MGAQERPTSSLALSPRIPSQVATQRRLEQAQARIAELEAQLQTAHSLNETSQTILQSAGEGIYGLDAQGCTTFVNPAAEAMTGWTASDLVGRVQHSVLHHSHEDGSVYPRALCPIYQAIHDGLVGHRDNEVFWRKDGTCFPVRYTSTPIMRNGRSVGAVVVFQNVTERKRKERWNRDKTAICLSMTMQHPIDQTWGLIANALAAHDSSWSVALLLRTGTELRLSAQANLPEPLASSYTCLPLGDESSACAWAASSGKTVNMARDTWKQDQALPIELSRADLAHACLMPLFSAARRVIGVLAIFSRKDVLLGSETEDPFGTACDLAQLAVEHQHIHHELVRRSQFDGLTGLPNNLLLKDRLQQAIVQAKRKSTAVAVCYLNLDQFKWLNEVLGNGEGDLLLQRVADALLGNLREIDTIARLAGDTFVIVLPDLDDSENAEVFCNRILERVRQPFRIDDQMRTVTASLGVSFFPGDALSDDLLLKHAESALHAAKQAGRDRWQRYSPALGKKIERYAAVQSALHEALKQDQFRLNFQGLFDTSRKLIGFEVLLRWTHPALGPIGPDEFIPIAEQTGIIVEIGAWVLHQACCQMKQWQSANAYPLKIFVNVSGAQLSRPDFTSMVTDALSQSGLDPTSLELEVTETWLMRDLGAASSQLQSLRELGVSIAIDDFGTGHSSFSSLHKLPVDTLKIDRSFTLRLNGTAKNASTIRAIIALANELGLQTVAEGVETEPQLRELADMGCGILQGFFLARPADADTATKLLIQHKSNSAKLNPAYAYL